MYYPVFVNYVPWMPPHPSPSQVITSASQNALVVFVGVPMIPLGLVALEAADVEGR